MDSNGFDANHLFHLYRYNFQSLDPSWKVNNLLVFNIPHRSFSRTCKTWGDIIDGAFKKILFSISHIIHRKDMGRKASSGSGIVDDLYYKDGVPKVVIVIEELKSQEGYFRGLRLWLLVLDPEFNFAHGFEEIVSENKKKADNAASNKERARRGTGGNHKKHGESGKNDNIADCYKSIYTPTELATNIWCPYLNSSNFFGEELDDLCCAKNGIANPEGRINPYFILTAENAMNLWADDICREQRTLDNYFDTNGGVGAHTFRGTFPLSESTFRMKNQYFSPEYLVGCPLPNCLKFQLGDKHVVLQEKRTLLEEAKRIFDELENSDASEDDRQVIFEQISLLEIDIRSLEDEMKDITRSFRRESPGMETFLIGTAAMKKMTERNEFMSLNEKNTKTWNSIFSKHAIGSPEYISLMEKTRKEAIKDFWEVFINSENVTPTVKSGRAWWKGLSPDMKYIENDMCCKNLSPFGNMIARRMAEYDKIFSMETNFQIMFIAHLVMYCSLRYSWKLRPNLLLTGEWATGKSFILELLSMLGFPGSTADLTHVTEQGMNGDDDMSDIAFIFHEANMRWFGVNPKDGTEIPADSFFKNRLTSQKAVTVHPDPDSKTRRSVISVSRAMNGYIMASNDKFPDSNSPALSRFLVYKMVRKNRYGTDENYNVYRPEYLNDTQNRDLILHGFQLSHFYILLIEKAIEANVFGVDIDLGVADQTSQWIFNDLVKQAVPPPPRRQVSMYLDMCRVMTIDYTVQMLFFSEIGLPIRKDSQGNAKDFNPLHLMHVPKWMVCNQEISVFVLTLMEQIFTPIIQRDIGKAIGQINRWPPNRADIKFRKLPPIPGQDGDKEDMRYIQITGPTLKDISSKIQYHLTEKFSTNDIMGALGQMRYQYIESPCYVWEETKVVADSPNMYKVKEEFPGERQKRQDRKRKEPGFRRVDLDDEQELPDLCDDNRSLIEYENQKMYDSKKFLQDYTLKTTKDVKESIPCVIMDSPPGANNRNMRISISVEFLYKVCSSNLDLKSTIIKAIQHERQHEVTYITGLPYERHYKEANKLEGEPFHADSKEIFYNLFDVITIPRGDKLKVIEHTSHISKTDRKLLYARVSDTVQPITLTEFQSRPASILDLPLDRIFCVAHWRKAGISDDDLTREVAYPPATAMVAWRNRATDGRYDELNELIIDVYPDEYIREYDEEKERKILVIQAAEKKEGKYMPFSDMCGTGTNKEFPFDPDKCVGIDFLSKRKLHAPDPHKFGDFKDIIIDDDLMPDEQDIPHKKKNKKGKKGKKEKKDKKDKKKKKEYYDKKHQSKKQKYEHPERENANRMNISNIINPQEEIKEAVDNLCSRISKGLINPNNFHAPTIRRVDTISNLRSLMNDTDTM